MGDPPPKKRDWLTPICDANGDLDSDILLKWGCAIVAIVLLAIRGICPLIYGEGASVRMPGMETIWTCVAISLGYGGSYLLKRGQITSSDKIKQEEKKIAQELAKTQSREHSRRELESIKAEAQVEVAKVNADAEVEKEKAKSVAGVTTIPYPISVKSPEG